MIINMETDFIIKAINSLSIFFLVFGFLIGVTRKISTVITLYRLQSFLLAFLALLIGYSNSEYQLYVSVIFIIAIKTIIIPQALGNTMKKVGIAKDMTPYLSSSLTMALEIILIIIAYQTVGSFFNETDIAPKNSLAVAIAVFLFGFFMMINRKKVISQVIGFLVMENGLFFFAISLAYGMPLIVELGIFFDVLVVALIMGVLVYKIKESIYSSDKKKFTKLVV